MLKYLCLINPAAGSGAGARLAAELLRLTRCGRMNGEVLETNPAELKAQCARLADFDAVLIGGGDGTIAMLLPYLADHEIKAGLLPLGTANDLAKELGVFARFSVTSPERLIEAYEQMPARDLQLWSLAWGDAPEQQALFSNYASIGFDARVVIDFAGRRPARHGQAGWGGVWRNRLGYARSACRHLGSGYVRRGRIQGGQASFSVDQIPVRSIFFSNIRSVMGLGVSRSDSIPFDRRLEASVLGGLLDYGAMLIRHPLPLTGAARLPGAEEWRIEALDPDVGIQLDGEGRPDLRHNAYRIQPAGRLRIMAACPAQAGLPGRFGQA